MQRISARFVAAPSWASLDAHKVRTSTTVFPLFQVTGLLFETHTEGPQLNGTGVQAKGGVLHVTKGGQPVSLAEGMSIT